MSRQHPIGEVREVQPLQPGDPRTVGPYVLIARLGSGGMGHVFLGRTRGGRTVAVKAVKPELAGDPEFRRRFRQEVAAARLVSGPHTAPVVDADPEAAMPWLATAYVSGQTLRAAVAEGWRLPEASLLVLAGGLARALSEIHAAGVVHRDLKPSNVMLAVEGPRVIDFGISRVTTATAATDFTRTDAGTIVGSPGFMSPEQSLGRQLSGATDVFSLGTVLAYAATGRNPFGQGPDHALLYRISHAEPDLAGVPDRLVPLVRACLEKDPARRPAPAQIIQHTAATPRGPWLPAALTAAIAQNAAEILDYEGIAVFAPPDAAELRDGAAAAGTGMGTGMGTGGGEVGDGARTGRGTEVGAAAAAAGAAAAAADGPGTGTRRTRLEPPTPETLVLPPNHRRGRAEERVGVGEAPRKSQRGGDGGGVGGGMGLEVITALSKAPGLALRGGDHHPDLPPAASVTNAGTTSPTPSVRSDHASGPSAAKGTGTSTPAPTSTSNGTVPTTAAASRSSEASATSAPSTTADASSTTAAPSSSSAPSTTPSSSSAPSSSAATSASSSASHSAAPSSPSSSRSTAPAPGHRTP